MRLGTIINRYRMQNKLSLGEFASMTGLSKTYIAMLEKGINSKTKKDLVPSIETIEVCAKAMNCSVDELLESLDDDQLININSNFSMGDLRQINEKVNNYIPDAKLKQDMLIPTAIAAGTVGLAPLGILLASAAGLAGKSVGKREDHIYLDNVYGINIPDRLKDLINYNEKYKIFENDIRERNVHDGKLIINLLDTADAIINKSNISATDKKYLIKYVRTAKERTIIIFLK